MTYLPELRIYAGDGPSVPAPNGEDLRTAVGMLEERWSNFPLIEYTQLIKATTPVASTEQMSGETGTTQHDTLWGESVPTAVKASWEQPHQNPDPAKRHAAEPSLYHPPVRVRARVHRTAREDFLKKVGFDRIRTLLLTIPASLLDAVGVTCGAGDRFTWDGELYEVLQWSPMGWFHTSNVKLMIVLNAEHARRGA